MCRIPPHRRRSKRFLKKETAKQKSCLLKKTDFSNWYIDYQYRVIAYLANTLVKKITLASIPLQASVINELLALNKFNAKKRLQYIWSPINEE